MSYDVAIVGASIAGCTAAKLFGERGARVALIEKRPDPNAYKTVCTHYIQPSATPVIEKLGLVPALEERGAIHNALDLWTPYSGWIRSLPDEPYGYNVTRQTLDPLLRSTAAEAPGVELLTGKTVTGVTVD
ncbi:MAG: FAD-dependent monooxygenase, partial [Actinomycetota bacterium]|nr:FAD-dependent monooxygenase [Actinomycetota bacterium]